MILIRRTLSRLLQVCIINWSRSRVGSAIAYFKPPGSVHVGKVLGEIKQ
jgi:hypothetical protein